MFDAEHPKAVDNITGTLDDPRMVMFFDFYVRFV